MGKGIIKSIGATTTTTVKTEITVTYDTTTVSSKSDYNGSTPVGDVITGTITDGNNDIPFQQPLGIELGVVSVGMKVYYNTVTVDGRTVANVVKPVEKGEVVTINPTDDSGTLKDRATGTIIPFVHLYCQASGLVPSSKGVKGSIVTFERVIDPTTAALTATALELAK